MARMSPSELLSSPIQVVNIGLEGFANDLRRAGVPAAHVEWSPPRRSGLPIGLLSELALIEAIDVANRSAIERMREADPVLIGVQPAGDVIAGIEDHMILHAGPPVDWPRMCGPLR